MVLAPFRVMRHVPLLTTTQHAVDPNLHYLKNLPADRTFINDRVLLGTVATNSVGPFPAVENLKAALDRVGVTYACVYRSNREGARLLRQAGFGHDRRIDKLRCLSP
jgi:hypothetical protein